MSPKLPGSQAPTPTAGRLTPPTHTHTLAHSLRYHRRLPPTTGADGSLYVGPYKDGERCGKGILKHLDGSKYTGEFKDDLQHGQGKYVEADGTTYDGEWAAGLMSGNGVRAYASGNRYNDFDIISTIACALPQVLYHHAPNDVLYVVPMRIGCSSDAE